MHLLLAAIVVILSMTPSSASGKTATATALSIPHSAFRIPHSTLSIAHPDQPPYLAQAGEQGNRPVDVYGFKRKSPTRAFLQSFLIPGWGQLYAKSAFWKPIAAVGIEAAGWAGYVSFSGKGHDKEDEYRAYADDHWDSTKYVVGLYNSYYYRDYPQSIGYTIEGTDTLINRYLDTTTYIVLNSENEIVPRSLSHHAWYKEDGASVARDEYYENIGKYNQFNFGWDDFPAVGTDSFPLHPDSSQAKYVSPNRTTYLGMRNDANSELSKANTMLIVTVANHLLWGFWAALDARAFNRAQDQFSHIETNLQLVKSPSNPQKYMPYLTMKYRF